MDTDDIIRVVCIEDETEMIELVRLILSRNHDGYAYELYGADGGEQGLQLVQQVQPDLILLDLMMPEMDGWEVYQHLRNHDNTRDIPVIIITAKADSIDKVLGLRVARVDDYVTKPFGPQELMVSIERVLREHGRISG